MKDFFAQNLSYDFSKKNKSNGNLQIYKKNVKNLSKADNKATVLKSMLNRKIYILSILSHFIYFTVGISNNHKL